MIHPRSSPPADGMRPARLSLRDALTLGILGLTRRRMRTLLSALGIAVGVTTLVVVTGIPASGQQALSDELTALGTDTLQAQLQPTQGAPATLLPDADAMVARIGPVTDATAVANTTSSVRRTDLADPSSSAGISVLASRNGLLSAINGSVASGTFLTPPRRSSRPSCWGRRPRAGSASERSRAAVRASRCTSTMCGSP